MGGEKEEKEEDNCEKGGERRGRIKRKWRRKGRGRWNRRAGGERGRGGRRSLRRQGE